MARSSKAKASKQGASNAMWGGRFSEGPSALMQRINASIFFDHKLYTQDIAGSIAHATMLADQKIITSAESKKMIAGLKQIEKEIAAGKMQWREELEDIHMHVESRLKEIIGPLAGKLHTGRSRNDQVATDFKLFVRDTIDALDAALQQLQATLIARAEQHVSDLLPGFTHLQIAQPVSFGHHLLAYVEMLGRDRSRLADARKRMNESPLGAAALAGTPYPINRKQTAKALGFAAPTSNSLDSVSDRDFAIEFLAAASMSMMHLSRLAEELINWSTPFFGFVTMSDAFTSGSSIMPQKKNPDAAELVRGKTGRVYGALISLLTTLKALPLAYNKDMQEDKEPVFDAAEQWAVCVAAMNGMIADMKVHTKRMDEVAGWGYATATDLADWLVRELGLPFREAHHVTGRIVAYAVNKDIPLHEVPLKEMQKVEKKITKGIFSVLTPAHSAASRMSEGGTAPKKVKKAIQTAKKKYL